MRIDDPFTPMSELFKEAQKRALKPERIRTIELSAEPEMRKLIGEEWKLALDDIKFEPVVIREEVKVERSALEILAEMTPKELTLLAVSRLFDIGALGNLLPQAPQTLSAAEVFDQSRPRIPRHDDALPTRYIEAPTPKKPRIAIITKHLRGQVGEIRNKAPQDVELVFVDRDKSAKQSALPTTADAVILHKPPHTWTFSAQSKFDSHKIHYVNGGVQAVVAKIFAIRSVVLAQNGGVSLTKVAK